MSWSKVDKTYKKPLIWWYHKVLCEFGWLFRFRDNYDMYYKHLHWCFRYGFTLYGEKISEIKWN